jgi:hypothetical protein
MRLMSKKRRFVRKTFGRPSGRADYLKSQLLGGVIPKSRNACSQIRVGSRSPVFATSIIFLATSSVIGS